MAFASMNPLRLRDAHLMCTAEFLISPPESLDWLVHMIYRINSVNPIPAEVATAVSLVMTSTPDGVRTGLVLRMRVLDEAADARQCAGHRDWRIPHWKEELEKENLHPVQPLADEGVYALLPREGLTFLRRTAVDPVNPGTVDFALLHKLISGNPGSGLCITLMDARDLDENAGMMEQDFLIAHWGLPAELNAATLEILRLPLEVCPEADEPLSGFLFLYDPWEQLRQITRKTRNPVLTRTHVQRLMQLLEWQPKAAPECPAEVPPAQSPAADVRSMTQSLLAGLPEMRAQMQQSVQQLRQELQQQVRQAGADALGEVQRRMGEAIGHLSSLPGAQQQHLTSLMERTGRIISSLTPHQAAEEARAAGLAGPIDALTLMKMGFSCEQELLDAGLDSDLLDLLRATVHLRQQCPDLCGEDANCMPYAFMIGYIYEALIKHCYVPLFQATGGYKKAHHLADYTRVNADHCQRLADFPGYRDRTLSRLTAQDWAAWMTLCNMLRALRNRQHSDNATGFICRREFLAAYEAFLFPGASAKEELADLPAFQADFPAYAREFKPDLPAEWGDTPDAQRRAVRRHMTGRLSAFDPSLLQFLLACRNADIPES